MDMENYDTVKKHLLDAMNELAVLPVDAATAEAMASLAKQFVALERYQFGDGS